jgi:hypothetical protein
MPAEAECTADASSADDAEHAPRTRVSRAELSSIAKCRLDELVVVIGDLAGFGSWYCCALALLAAAPCFIARLPAGVSVILKQDRLTQGAEVFSLHGLPARVSQDASLASELRRWCCRHGVSVCLSEPDMALDLDGWLASGRVSSHSPQLFYRYCQRC